MEAKIDIEEILINQQIKFIKREVEDINIRYCGRYIDSYGREYDIDYDYFKITSKYEPLIEDEDTNEGKLNIYKKMYQECLDLVYEEIESKEVPLVYERCMCGTDGVLIIYEEDL